MAQFPEGGTVTLVEPQKRRKNRVNVHIDGEFAFGLDREVAEKHGIAKDRVLSREEIRLILEEEEYKRGLNRAFRILAARSRSEKEVRDRLLEAGYPEVITEKIIARCRELGFLNDTEFAFRYAEDRLRNRPMSQEMLKRELMSRGIGEELADRAADKAFAQTDELELARKLVSQKIKRWRGEPKDKAREKMARFLVSRGFGWEIVQTLYHEFKSNFRDPFADES